jgi:hypothetical protein
MITWTQDPDRTTWRASLGAAVLTVTRAGLDIWCPKIKRPGSAPEQGPTARDRATAQRWAEWKARGNG